MRLHEALDAVSGSRVEEGTGRVNEGDSLGQKEWQISFAEDDDRRSETHRGDSSQSSAILNNYSKPFRPVRPE